MHGSAREDTAGSRKQQPKHKKPEQNTTLEESTSVKFRSMQDEFMVLQVHT